ncbi:MAG TPA: hypothetical protein VE983_13555, partial [Solirubrobacteraceae bacterium]|nr:hypothetical protein [Solirubrobacteraceae bacterium]
MRGSTPTSGTVVDEPGAARPSTSPGALSTDVRLVSLTKSYGDVLAVDGVNVEIARGEFFTLLGPSGSGK